MRVRGLIAIGVAALPLAPLAVGDPAPAPPVRSLEERVAGLRDKLAPPNARLRDLQQRVGAELSAGARAVLIHRNELGPAYQLVAASYALDGAGADGPRALPRGRVRKVLDRRVAAGAHRVSAELVFEVREGEGPRRRLELRSSHAFDARPGAVTRVTLVTHPRAAPAGEEPAAVRFELVAQAESPGDGAPASATAARP